MGSTVQALDWDAQSEPDADRKAENSELFVCLRLEDKEDLLMLLGKSQL